jgi:hypothetical protein
MYCNTNCIYNGTCIVILIVYIMLNVPFYIQLVLDVPLYKITVTNYNTCITGKVRQGSF